MHHDLQITRLRTFVTVVDRGGFRRAAEALHITQPAVSQQIRQLGTILKGPVFLSTGRELKLSPQGTELLGYARRIVALNDEAVSRFIPTTGSTRISVGVVEQLADALPEILRLFARQLPRAQVTVQTGLSESLEGQVTSGQFDCALLLQNQLRLPPSLSCPLGLMRMDWFGRPAYGEGAELPLTLFSEPCTLRGPIMEAFSDAGVSWRVGYEGDQFVGVRSAAQAGLGVACLIANGDELWGLPKTVRSALPSPPGPVPVTLAMSGPGAASGIGPIAEKTFQNALRDYPFVE
ncbi:LysR substrate-binding domain-containing protein [Spirillospora sp. NPDC048911]|uniref:LysR substrate-binding domain-containing protein n=1 Tax=Spirillospora sp. NPDC048911 TaxID=3364527 RepID=UPI003717C0C8